MKINKLYFLIILIFITLSNFSYGLEQLKNNDKSEGERTIWSFNKISKNNVLHNKNILEDSLLRSYINTKIILDEQRLIINDICSIEYVKHKKTPLNYWISQKNADLYSQLFLEEGMPLGHYINIIMALYPEQDCQSPYDEIIEKNSYLVIIAQEHLLFFKKNINNKAISNLNYQFENEFPKYCKDLNEGKTFDGTDKYICTYPNKKLLETYLRIKNITNRGLFMKEKLPLKNLKYSIQDSNIMYQWIKPNMLKIIMEQGSESSTYLFEENKNSTKLTISIETGY